MMRQKGKQPYLPPTVKMRQIGKLLKIIKLYTFLSPKPLCQRRKFEKGKSDFLYIQVRVRTSSYVSLAIAQDQGAKSCPLFPFHLQFSQRNERVGERRFALLASRSTRVYEVFSTFARPSITSPLWNSYAIHRYPTECVPMPVSSKSSRPSTAIIWFWPHQDAEKPMC